MSISRSMSRMTRPTTGNRPKDSAAGEGVQAVAVRHRRLLIYVLRLDRVRSRRQGCAYCHPIRRARKPARSSVWWWICGAARCRARRERCAFPAHAARQGCAASSSNIAARAGSGRPAAKTVSKARRVGLGVKPGMFDAVDRIEKPVKPARGKDLLGIGRAAVGIDDLAPRQGGDARGKAGSGSRTKSRCRARRSGRGRGRRHVRSSGRPAWCRRSASNGRASGRPAPRSTCSACMTQSVIRTSIWSKSRMWGG